MAFALNRTCRQSYLGTAKESRCQCEQLLKGIRLDHKWTDKSKQNLTKTMPGIYSSIIVS